MKKTHVLFIESAVLAIVFAQMASAATYYVATNGTGDGTSWANATNRIQGAISLCAGYDVVLVSNGVYDTGGVTGYPGEGPGLLTNRVAITTQYVTVRSANNDPTNTIIKGAGPMGAAAVRCVYMITNTTLIGFTLTNGATKVSENNDGRGGGVWGYHSGTTISNCIIAHNSAFNYGGVWVTTARNCVVTGNYAGGSAGGVESAVIYDSLITDNYAAWRSGGAQDATLRNCIIINNGAYIGGGVYGCGIYNCIVSNNRSGSYAGGAGGSIVDRMTNCVVVNNSAKTDGGGVYEMRAINCTISGNYATNHGGGACSGILVGCVIAGNSAKNNGGGGFACIMSNCTVVGNSATNNGGGVFGGTSINSIIYFNDAAAGSNWSGVSSWTNSCTTTGAVDWAAGNITNDPLFITNGSGYGLTHAMGNYRLRNNSPCINAGLNQNWMTNGVDLDGRARIRYGTVDMGAYEKINEGTTYGFR